MNKRRYLRVHTTDVTKGQIIFHLSNRKTIKIWKYKNKLMKDKYSFSIVMDIYHF